ncbi:disulfide bond formation protein B [Neorhizobium sp. NPDC001467]|uniref:disulfide bond formation protein B n=1 Tax=Neorhizobium sp. NPDC001467 TaxID=3390595 RepID=UPI003CFE32B9
MAHAATSASTRGIPQIVFPLTVTVGMTAVISSALAFQHIGGYMPCHLCLIQRDPYYYGIPAGILAIGTVAFRLPSWTGRVLLALIGLMMLVGGAIAVYHAGVEWGFWAGPSSCTNPAGSVTTSAAGLLDDLNTVRGPSCDAAALRVLGLSMAGWNVLASLALAAIAFAGAVRKRA